MPKRGKIQKMLLIHDSLNLTKPKAERENFLLNTLENYCDEGTFFFEPWNMMKQNSILLVMGT